MWKDPTNADEWKALFVEAEAAFGKFHLPNPIQIGIGEVIDPSQINPEIAKVDPAWKELQEIKDKVRQLDAIAKRWYDQKKVKAILECRAVEMREIYSSDGLRNAYAEDQAADLRKLCDASATLLESIHDERSRLFQYRKDLEQIGHNARWSPRL
jgi:conjugal transfer/entry exclusion protein